MKSTETFIDGCDGISSEGWDDISGDGYAIDLSPISI